MTVINNVLNTKNLLREYISEALITHTKMLSTWDYMLISLTVGNHNTIYMYIQSSCSTPQIYAIFL